MADQTGALTSTATGSPSDRAAAPGYLKAIAAVVWKDAAVELRSRELIGATLIFALLVILIFNFALELQVRFRETVISGVLWSTLAFAGTLALNRSMAMERERNCLDGLLLTPVDRTAIYFGKACANLVFMLIVSAIVLPILSALYNVRLLQPGVFGTMLLGTIGYSAVGTLLSAMAVQTRTRDILLPILLFPVVLPILIAAVKASNGFLQGLEMAEIAPWINLMLVYDVIFIAVAMMVFEFVVQE